MGTLTKSMAAALAISLAMLAAVACGKPTPDAATQTTTTSASVAKVKASCDARETRGTCTEFPDRKSFDLEKVECDAAHGKFALTPCPAVDQVGTCKLSDGDAKRYYRSFASDALADCAKAPIGGTFSSSL